ncbi:hypothetical protein AB9P05_19990 [Roseivirga sp. BDSF3-8]|uniref:hypothetical protein n=1 Tax=Roseivirga sp. BDSF3-8 TaxID=3241598 RepID=UPI0035321FF9
MKKDKMKLKDLTLDSFTTSLKGIRGGNLTFCSGCGPTHDCPTGDSADQPELCSGGPDTNCIIGP